MDTNFTEKENILQKISFLDAETLAEKIMQKVITLGEATATMRLDPNKKAAIELIINKVEEKAKVEENYWLEVACKINTQDSYNKYLLTYPKGVYVEIALGKIAEILEIRRKKIEHIRNNPMDYNRQIINRMLNNEEIDKQDIVSLDIITFNDLNEYLSPSSRLYSDQHNWTGIAKLPANKTDVYFIGFPNSGKTCVLQGLLTYAIGNSKFSADTINGIGYNYMRELINGCDLGIVPPSTGFGNDINFISGKLLSPQNHHHVNFIEMAGEYVRDYYNFKTNNQKQQSTSKYKDIWNEHVLLNNNRKIFNFVFDYSASLLSKTNRNDQLMFLSFWFKEMEREDIFSKTDGIQIILTKTDLFSTIKGGKMEQTKVFLEENFKNFIEEIRELCRKKSHINRGVINKHGKPNGILYQPFSLGEFIFQDLFNFVNTDSERILEQVTNLIEAESPRGGGFFSKMLN